MFKLKQVIKTIEKKKVFSHLKPRFYHELSINNIL